MDQTIKNKWVKALRSGTYKQAKQRLRSSKGFCCLGVLCDVIDSTKWVEGNSFFAPHYFHYFYNGWSGMLPQDIMEMAKLDKEDAQILMDANDCEDWSFDDIATYVDIML